MGKREGANTGLRYNCIHYFSKVHSYFGAAATFYSADENNIIALNCRVARAREYRPNLISTRLCGKISAV